MKHRRDPGKERECRYIGGPFDGRTEILPGDYPYDRFDKVEVAPLDQHTEETIPMTRYIYRLEPAFPDDPSKAHLTNLIFEGAR